MRTKFLLIAIWIFGSNYLGAQPSIQWQKCYGGSYADQATSIKQTGDGGYIVTGYTWSIDGDVLGHHHYSTNYSYLFNDYWVVKMDNIGVVQWKKCFGGFGDDKAYSIQQTSDGGYIIAGYTWSYDNGDVSGKHSFDNIPDYWVVKIDSIGTIQWQKCLGGTGGDEAYSIQQTTDNGYIVAGVSPSNDGDVTGNHGASNYWIVKLDTSGIIQWQKSLGGSVGENAKSIRQTSDGGYIVAGNSYSNDWDVTGHHGSTDSSDCWVVKLDNSGAIQWQKSLGGTQNDYAYSIEQTTDAGYIVAGWSTSLDGDVTRNQGYSDYWIVKLNGNGNIQWQKSFGGSYIDEAFSVQQTVNGGYIVAGKSTSLDGDITGHHDSIPIGHTDYWVLLLDSNGVLQWQKSLGGTCFDDAYSIMQTSDNGYIVAGSSCSADGDVTGVRTNYDYWIVKLSPYTGINETDANDKSFKIYPNPLTSSFILELNVQVKDAEVIIYDMVGKEVARRNFSGDRIEMARESLESGMYFVKLNTNHVQLTKKIIIE